MFCRLRFITKRSLSCCHRAFPLIRTCIGCESMPCLSQSLRTPLLRSSLRIISTWNRVEARVCFNPKPQPKAFLSHPLRPFLSRFSRNMFQPEDGPGVESSPKAISKLLPPVDVKGMTVLDKSKFSKSIEVPFVVVEKEKLTPVITALKPFLLKLFKCQPVQENPDDPETKLILMNPDLVDSLEDLSDKTRKVLAENNVKGLQVKDVSVGYDNFKSEEILRAVLSSDESGVSSWSNVGHIIHLNLRNHLLPFKHLIGQVLLDKNQPRIKLVVNKLSEIDTEFRFFKMETLAKITDDFEDTVVKTHENSCDFTFDFANVYWNPRLCTEHLRIIEKLRNKIDVIYDVFAGVGPFAIPAAKRKCQVFANDLNPECYKWLLKNAKMNKVEARLKAFNLDGREFLRTVVRPHLLEQWEQFDRMEITLIKRYHIVMNLPALAMEFMDVFRGWMDDEEDRISQLKEIFLPQVHCYCFVRKESGDHSEAVVRMVEKVLQSPLNPDLIQEIINVRTVAPLKEMYRISFILPRNVLFTSPQNKKLKLE